MTSTELKEKIDTAFAYHKQGMLAKAEAIYSEVLAIEPDNANVLNLFGLLLCQNKQYEKATEYIEKAASLAPSAYLYTNLGGIYDRINRVDNAIDAYNKGLELENDNFNIIYGLGISHEKKNDYNTASIYYEKAKILQPNNHGLYSNLGICYIILDRPQEAINNLKKALELKPDDYNSYVNLGDLYKKIQLYSEAIDCYNNAINCDPNNYRAYLSLALTQLKTKDIKEAERTIEIILKIKPDEAEILLDLGLLYEDNKLYDKAFETYSKILHLKPDSYKAYLNIAEIHIENESYDKAIEACQKALNINPNYANAYLNLGNAYKDQKKYYEAISCFEKALSIEPDHINAHFNLGTTHLLLENYDLGWFHYEWRLIKKNPNQPPLPKLNQPTWKGEPLAGKTIYICYEQGLGDVIQFSRYLNTLDSMGAKVIFKTQPELETLLKQSNIKAKIINKKQSELELEFDTYLYLMSLPLYLRVNTSNIPFREGYIKSNKEIAEKYKKEYFENDYFKIGICWQTSVKGTGKRGISLKYFHNLAKIKNVKLYSLQKGIGTEELDDLPEGVEIIDLGKTFNDFSDTAAAVENLDLVISTDTSVAHLAGAMNKPVWTLITFMPSWRWHEDKEDTCWYKSMKLFRQKTPNDWNEVFEKVALKIKEHLK